MSAIREAQEIDHERRRLLGSMAAAVITGNLSFAGAAFAQSNQVTIPSTHPIAENSRASMNIASSLVASDTTCLRNLHKNLPKL